MNLRCKVEGKKIAVNDGHVVIEDAGPSLITFYIDDTQYQAEEGMTWDEWVESEYNTGGFYLSDINGWLAITDGNYKYIVFSQLPTNKVVGLP